MGNALNARIALAKHEFHYTHSLGQNFLLDDVIIERIVDCAGVQEDDKVLEIGAGAGVLTAALAARSSKVLSLELDRQLEPVLNDVLANEPNVIVLFADVLKADLYKITKEWFGDASFKVVANLPYYITADVILRLVKLHLPIESITVMVQQEAAERIMSTPGSKSWCALAATVQYFGAPEILMQVPPSAFTPQPHVMSCLLGIHMYGDDKPCQAADDSLLLKLITAAFAMRRKTLANNLTASFSMNREEALALIESQKLDARVRGEALSVKQLCEMADALHKT